MADTLPDIRITRTAYTDVYTATNIPRGSNLIIQNKTTTGLYIQVRATQPAAASTDGYLLMSNEACIVESSHINGVWISGAGAVSIQVYE